MPSYMPKEEIFGYTWAGARLGNAYTCNAQGFFATFGIACMFNYNAMLCVYYACAIAFTMREKKIKKYVEPILHGLPIIAGLTCAVPPLFHQMYNPGISAYAWCGPLPYPDECTFYPGVECIRGNAKMKKILQYLMSTNIISAFVFISVSLLLVVFKVIQTDRVLLQISKLYRDRGHSEMERVLQRHRNTKVVILQAFSYITAFLLSVLPPLLLSIGAIDYNSGNIADSFEKVSLALLPLQGFFNFFIFVSHKVYNYRRGHDDVSISRVLFLLFFSSAHEPFFISRISVVQRYDEEQATVANVSRNVDEDRFMSKQQEPQQGESNMVELDMHDESNIELHYRLALMNKNDSSGDFADGGNMIVWTSAGDDSNNLVADDDSTRSRRRNLPEGEEGGGVVSVSSSDDAALSILRGDGGTSYGDSQQEVDDAWLSVSSASQHIISSKGDKSEIENECLERAM
eukprot:CAMPEP_0176488746 /NCGR_PEP_ID=MMETSP0200_2-20121128/6887_1 /TAXON_ID=947934 /ORGANISM="Chaetoceros sp., Strain GSL56" /LENGTH=458 /DNA_ID=CAMNT_0017885777 /DNA_START=1 /DNA_END=1377 /DNA_ORIENTATION=+